MNTPILDFLSKKIKSNDENIFTNDFSKIVYIVNNVQRKQQLEYAIFNEMKNSNDRKTIIPPKIMDYKLAFLLQSAKYLLTNYNTDDITEYSEDWIQFLMYEIAENLIENTANTANITNDKYRRKENVTRNLAQELGKYIGYIVMNLKEDNVLNYQNNDNDAIIQWFIDAIKKYNEKGKDWNEKNSSLQKFYNPLFAYKLLYKKITEENFQKKDDEILLIEDFDSMEPIFQKIAEKIGCIKIESKPDSKTKPDSKKPQLYEFMTDFDEIESICFKIKQLLAENRDLSSHQILIVPCNARTKEMLTLTLQRFGLSHTSKQNIGSTKEYNLLLTYYKIKTNQFNGNYYQLVELLESEISNCKITKNVDVRRKLAEQGIRLINEPLKVINEIYENLSSEQKNTSPYTEFKEHILTTSDSINAVDALKIIKHEYYNKEKIYKPQPGLMNTLVEMCVEIDKMIKPTEGKDENEKKEKAKKVLLLMELASEREYYVYNKKNDDEINHFIPVITP
ncbi:MAG: hypothetical protein SNJ64_03940, partial [Endomicrobiia bacterium]